MSTSRQKKTPIGLRTVRRGAGALFDGVSKKNVTSQLLAGLSLLAIAFPEQLATAQLAGVPALVAIVAFIAGSLVFGMFGSNPIVSIGADSTIAPLFAVALARLAPMLSSEYLTLVATTAVVTGVLIALVGYFRLGWIADFMSLPIVTGFMAGIGVLIIVHRLPSALGVRGGGDSIFSRLHDLAKEFPLVHWTPLLIALCTLLLMLVGERVMSRGPWALVALVTSTVAVVTLHLRTQGVAVLGALHAEGAVWRLHVLSMHAWSVVFTTSLTLVIVMLSQTAATSRSSADVLGVADNLNRDLLALGLANVASGAVGAFAVNASPARTSLAMSSGGTTRMVGIVAAFGALAVLPLSFLASNVPLAGLSGILFFVAFRLINVRRLAAIFRISRLEAALSGVATLGVVLLGVESGLALAVGLAILSQTWRSSRPQMVELLRRKGTTSWEPSKGCDFEKVDHILALMFTKDLFFANAAVFRTLLHGAFVTYPKTRHVILDAVAISEIDYTGLTMLTQVVSDLHEDGVTFSIARANALVTRLLQESPKKAIRKIKVYASVDEAARAALAKL